MTVIDTHTHIGTSDHIFASTDQLLQSMDEAKIDKALVLAAPIANIYNTMLLSEVQKHPDRLAPIAYADVGNNYPFDKHILDILDQVVGAKFYTGYEYYYASDERVYNICQKLQEKNKPVYFHGGDCLASCKNARVKYSFPMAIDDLAVSLPDLKIVIAHMAWPFVRETSYLCWKHPNVYADVSGMTYGGFDNENMAQFRRALHEFLDIGPASKLLFGTDFPVCNQKAYVEAMKDMVVSGHRLSPELLSQNAEKVFKWKD